MKILLKGYSTNWNFSALKIKLAGSSEQTQNTELSRTPTGWCGNCSNRNGCVTIRLDVQ